jgi:hypothetical protein
MKLRLKRLESGEWESGVYRGNGGISSMIASRISRSLLKAIGVFSFKNIYRSMTW